MSTVFAAFLILKRSLVPALLLSWFVTEIALNHAFASSTNFYLNFASVTLPIEFIFGAAIGWLYVNKRLPPTWLSLAGAIVATTIAFYIKISTNDEYFPIDRVWFFGIPAALIVMTAITSEVRGAFVAP